MNFFTMIRIYRSADVEISLRDVWTIADGELNDLAELVWKRLREEKDLAALHREVAWASQALTEFADLVGFTRCSAVRVQDGCYLYFEAVSALREATVGMANGSPRAATGLLRSVMEMLLLHCWWQERLSRTDNASQFYEWLKGRRKKPKMRDVIADNFERLGLPADEGAIQNVYRTYDRLCEVASQNRTGRQGVFRRVTEECG